jgi:triacylglycerol esterase/lipase EstA (alpha/beta hydrolase family)
MRAGLRGITLSVVASALTLATVATAAVVVSAAPAGAAPLPVGTIVQGALAEIFSPESTPPGMNNWSCVPSAAHPYPVILVHGTVVNEALSWQALSPELVNAGYCVYGFNYGEGPESVNRVDGESDIATSAEQLATFIFYVLTATKAAQVDIVGHSQGGMMPRYAMKYLGDGPKVHMLVGLAPSNHGTTLDSSAPFLAVLHGLGLNVFNLIGCISCTQQVNGQGQSVIANLNAGGETVPGVQYVVIESRYDEVVTPYTSAFLNDPGVQNILLQDQCPLDFSEHIGIIYDPVALQDVMNALGPDDPSFQPACSFVPPGIG